MIVGTFLLLCFIGALFRKLFESVDGCYKKIEQGAGRAGWLYRHGIIRKVK